MLIQSNQSTSITIDGRDYLYFGGTNYLGLAHRAELWDAASRAFERYGFSCGASRLTSGENELILELEFELARFAKRSAGLVLPAGFMANTAVVEALDEAVDYWIISKYAHGSIKSAVARCANVLMVDGFAENGQGKTTNRRTLRGRLGLPENSKLGFFVEPIDPLLGTLTDVAAISALLGPNDFLVLDEAHSFGVLGDTGAGATQHFKIPPSGSVISTGTFSKALGAYGGFVVGERTLIDQIKLKSACFKVSTPLTPVACAASLESLKLVQCDPKSTTAALRRNIERTNTALADSGFGQFEANVVPIYHLLDTERTRLLRDSLPEQGLYLPTVTSYFADYCEIGLRWTIQAGHTEQHLDRLLTAIAKSQK